MSPTLSGTLAVVSQSGETLTFYDAATWTPTSTIRNLPAEPHELAYDARRNLLYVSHTYRHGHYLRPGALAHEISVVDMAARAVVDTIDTRPALAPHGLAIDGTHDILYATVEKLENEEHAGDGSSSSSSSSSNTAGGVIGIDLATRKTTRRVPSHSRPHWLALTPDGGKAYTCNKGAPFVSVLDLAAGKMAGRIAVPGSEHPDVSPDGARVFFPTPELVLGAGAVRETAVKVIDTARDAVVASLPFAAALQPVHVTARGVVLVGKLAAMPAEISADSAVRPARLAVLDAKTYEEVGDVELGGLPLTIRSSPDGRLAFVANIMPGTVSVVDLEELRVVATLDNDTVARKDKAHHQGAHGLAFIPA